MFEIPNTQDIQDRRHWSFLASFATQYYGERPWHFFYNIINRTLILADWEKQEVRQEVRERKHSKMNSCFTGKTDELENNVIRRVENMVGK